MYYKHTAIIIEPRRHKALNFVLNNILECLSEEWKIVFFHGVNNVEYSKKIVDNLNQLYNSRVNLVNLNVDNLNQKTYSKLLATKSIIYDYIDTEYFLVFQTDSMIIKANSHLINHFLEKNYDYVGAPWLICDYQPTKSRDFIGNGGFSLRKTKTMLKIIKNNLWDENYEWQEDLFFSKKYNDIYYIKPNYESAKLFCVDEIFSPVTMACHNFWRHSHFHMFCELYPECKILYELQDEEN
jgi:hypothetical protein